MKLAVWDVINTILNKIQQGTKLDPCSYEATKAVAKKAWKKFPLKPQNFFCCTINLKIGIIIRFCMADELNGQALPVHHTKPYKYYNFQNAGASWYFGIDSEIWCTY